ncbi:MAG TPA: tRNA (guanosine(37)-N1)-methyltransferase TrmD [Spirochaetota bacterium]|nr:tRNA (guanosine(37)-N1)-methyltransferase TrmD [Spirochaetota bacterium]
MFFDILSLFPEKFHSFFRCGMLARAVQTGLIDYRLLHIRAYGEGNYRHVDDYPFGTGQGMLLKYSVMKKCLAAAGRGPVILLSPRGQLLKQNTVNELSRKNRLVLVCGHYEGVDQRFINRYVDREIAIGDYVLSSGETAAMVLIEAVSRKLKTFMGNEKSAEEESFETGLLEYDQYTRPREVDGMRVPRVLLSGDHHRIRQWNRLNALYNTYCCRPDLIDNTKLTAKELKFLNDLQSGKKMTGEYNEYFDKKSRS